MTDPTPLSEREERWYTWYSVNRWTLQKIADREGVTNQYVSQVLADVRRKLPPVDIDAIRQQSLRLHQDVQRRAFELADMRGAPVTAGKDGDILIDPEDQTVVRDYAGRVAAMKLALEADREIRKLMGADAATKTETTGSVRYEVVGVDPAALA